MNAIANGQMRIIIVLHHSNDRDEERENKRGKNGRECGKTNNRPRESEGEKKRTPNLSVHRSNFLNLIEFENCFRDSILEKQFIC